MLLWISPSSIHHLPLPLISYSTSSLLIHLSPLSSPTITTMGQTAYLLLFIAGVWRWREWV